MNVGKNWTLQMSIPQYLVLVLKLTPINMVSLNSVFLIPQNQCYPGNPCTMLYALLGLWLREKLAHSYSTTFSGFLIISSFTTDQHCIQCSMYCLQFKITRLLGLEYKKFLFYQGPFKYYVIMNLTFFDPPTHLIIRHHHFLYPP